MVLPQLRMALLLFLLALPAGCFGGSTPSCSTCAQPTDTPATCERCTVPPTPPPDSTDPGYPMTSTWHVGDAWDYYSNQSRYHSDRIVEARQAGQTKYFLLDEAVGIIGNAPSQRIRTWFDATNWTRLNVTYPGGTIMTNFTPGAPERFLHNGTLRYNQSDGNRGTTTNWSFIANAYFGDTVKGLPWAGYQKVALPWGSTLAARIEYRALRTPDTGPSTGEFTVRYVSDEYANDVQYRTVGGEIFKLVATKVGDKQYGTLIGR